MPGRGVVRVTEVVLPGHELRLASSRYRCGVRPIRYVALAAFTVLIAACGGSGGSANSSSTDETTTTTMAVGPPERLTQQLQSLITLEDQELPADLMHLVPSGLGFSAVPEPFSTSRFGWFGRGYRPFEGDGPEVSLATRLHDSDGAAANAFAAGAAAVRSGTGLPASQSEQSIYEIPSFGDESIGVQFRQTSGSIERWVTRVVARYGPLLTVVTISRETAVDDREAVVDLARLVDGRVQAILRGELTLPPPLDPGEPRPLELAIAPPRQLTSFEFEATLNIRPIGLAQTLTVTGEYQATNRMRCRVEVEPAGESYDFASDGESFAVAVDGEARILADGDPVARLARACPGHLDFFDRGFPITELGLYEFDDNADFTYVPFREERVLDGLPAMHYIAEGPGEAGRMTDMLGEVERVDAWFHLDDGWIIQMQFSGEMEYGYLFDGDEGLVAIHLEYLISRPNDPSIVVELPDILEAQG